MLGLSRIGRHGKMRALLSSYIDGEVREAEARRVERHLASCDSCEQETAGLRGTVELLRALPELEVPRSFALESLPARAPARRPAIVWVPALGTSLAAVLLVAVIAGDALGIVEQADDVEAPLAVRESAAELAAPASAAPALAMPAPAAAPAPMAAAAPLAAPARPAAPAVTEMAAAAPEAAASAGEEASAPEATPAPAFAAAKAAPAPPPPDTAADATVADTAQERAPDKREVGAASPSIEAAEVPTPGLRVAEVPQPGDQGVSFPLRQVQAALGLALAVLTLLTMWSLQRARNRLY